MMSFYILPPQLEQPHALYLSDESLQGQCGQYSLKMVLIQWSKVTSHFLGTEGQYNSNTTFFDDLQNRVS